MYGLSSSLCLCYGFVFFPAATLIAMACGSPAPVLEAWSTFSLESSSRFNVIACMLFSILEGGLADVLSSSCTSAMA